MTSPKVSLGTVHKASLWVLPAGIHLKTAEHNFGIKVELDLKAKKMPKANNNFKIKRSHAECGQKSL